MSDTVSGPLTADSIAGAAYIVAALLFILSLAGLSKHEKARAGVIYGIAGMVIALAATVWLTVQGAWGTGHGLTGLILVSSTVYLYLASGRVYGVAGWSRIARSLLLALAVGVILVGYRFAIFLVTLYTT